MENKVTFGLSNVHIAKLIENNGNITYDTPFALPGGVTLTMDKEGAMSIFRADNIDYYKKANLATLSSAFSNNAPLESLYCPKISVKNFSITSATSKLPEYPLFIAFL